MHLFLQGPSGVGKTTLIQAALLRHGIVPCGFTTRKLPGPGESQSVYFNPAGAPPVFDTNTLVAVMPKRAAPAPMPARFDALGVAALAHIPPGALVLMDELGRLEQDAAQFCARVLRVLDMDCRVLGVLQCRDVPFLNAVRAHPAVSVLDVCVENREQIAADLDAFLTGK